MSPPTVRYVRDGAVGVITLDRPPVNAYDTAMHRGLSTAWRAAGDDEGAHVIVLRAENKHFCAGSDVSIEGPELAGDESGPSPVDDYAYVRNLPKPTIAAVQGGCVGGGQRFVFPCDLIFCSDDAFFADPLVRFGSGGIPPPLHAWLYGPRLAKELLFGCGRIDAERLYQAGSVNRIYPRAELTPSTLEFAHSIAEHDPQALREAKRSVDMTMDISGQHYIHSRFADLMESHDYGHPRS